MHLDKNSYQVIFGNKYLIIKYFPSPSLLMLHWANTSDNMTTKDFEDSISVVPNIIKKYSPKRFFNNMKNFRFPLDTHKTNMPMKILSMIEEMPEFDKQAYVLPTKIDCFMAIRNLIDQLKPQFTYNIFINEEDALEWLLS